MSLNTPRTGTLVISCNKLMQYLGLSSRIMQIQVQMAERALELLMLPDDTPCYVLDIGWVWVYVNHAVIACLCVGVALA